MRSLGLLRLLLPGPFLERAPSSGIPHQIVLPRQCPFPSPSFPRACISVLEPVQVSLLIRDCGPCRPLQSSGSGWSLAHGAAPLTIRAAFSS